MCDGHYGFADAFSESETHGFSEGHSEGRSRRYSRPFSTSWAGSSTDAEDVERFPYSKTIVDLSDFRQRIRRAAQWLTVAEFARLRRRYDRIWLEVLEEL